MTNDIEMIMCQRCAIIVVCGARDKPEWVPYLLMRNGDLTGFSYKNTAIVALNHSREAICSLEQIREIANELFQHCKIGRIWLVVVNGYRDISLPFGRITPIEGIPSELICLYSTEQRPLPKPNRE